MWGFQAALGLSLVGAVFGAVALVVTFLHASRCPVLERLDEAVESAEKAERKARSYLTELDERAERVGRLNSRLGAERAKLERAQQRRGEEAAPETNGGLSAADAAWMQRAMIADPAD